MNLKDLFVAFGLSNLVTLTGVALLLAFLPWQFCVVVYIFGVIVGTISNYLSIQREKKGLF